MKTVQHYWGFYMMMLLVQIILTDVFTVTPLITLSLMPALILCLPTDLAPYKAMIIAFISGLVLDLFSDALLGINTAPLVLVAAMRYPLFKLIFDNDVVERGDGFSIRKNGFAKVATILFACVLAFLIFYIILDSAGERTFWFNVLRVVCSLPCCFILGLIAVNYLTRDDQR